MKLLPLFLPFLLFLVSCSSETAPDNKEKQVADSLVNLIRNKNTEIGELVSGLPKLYAVVQPVSIAVHAGENFEGEIYLAGQLTIPDRIPEIYVENFRLPASSGLATYRIKATQEGLHTYSGVIKVRSQYDGQLTEYPFSGSYYVSASAPAAKASSAIKLDSVCPYFLKTGKTDLPGHEQDYKVWISSTRGFVYDSTQTLAALSAIGSRQDSIIRSLNSMHGNELKFDKLTPIVSPVSPIVRPGDEYIAFIYLGATSTIEEMETTINGSKAKLRNGETIRFKAGEAGIQAYQGKIVFEDRSRNRDSIAVNGLYFAE